MTTYVTPPTWNVGQVLSADDLNTYGAGNVAALAEAKFITAQRTTSMTVTNTAPPDETDDSPIYFNMIEFTGWEAELGGDYQPMTTLDPFTALPLFEFGLYEVSLRVEFPESSEIRRIAIGLQRFETFQTALVIQDAKLLAGATSFLNCTTLLDLGIFTSHASFDNTGFSVFAHVEDRSEEGPIDVVSARMTVVKIGQSA